MVSFFKNLLGISTKDTKAFLIYVCYFLIINIIAFLLMFIDKKLAIRNSRPHGHHRDNYRYSRNRRGKRIPENLLLSLSIIGGALGTEIGMYTFRHKTKKSNFTVGVPLLLCVNIIVFSILIVMLYF